MKKQKKWPIREVLFILIFLLLFSCSYAAPPSIKTASYLLDQGNVKVYFCPQENCENIFLTLLNSATASLHCALYEIDLESVKRVLLEKSKTIDVQIVTDSDYFHQFNHSFVKTDSFGLMHNKFCIIDGSILSTGSMNPTDNDAHKNNNNLLIINSTILARNFEAEFQELWNRTFKKGKVTANPAVKIGDVMIESYFCPDDLCAQRVKQEIMGAEKSLYFMTFSFTHAGIAHALLLRSLSNVSVRGVMEARQVTKDSVYALLSYQLGTDAVRKDGNPRNMHHKVFMIDNKTVITGSFNPTKGGDERNDENLLIIHDKAIAHRFVEEFWKVYEEGMLPNSGSNVASSNITSSSSMNSTSSPVDFSVAQE